ncbi:MAG: flagellar biosynthesis anti-sigma factor FlgM [Oscillospiraceae bacterium]
MNINKLGFGGQVSNLIKAKKEQKSVNKNDNITFKSMLSLETSSVKKDTKNSINSANVRSDSIFISNKLQSNIEIASIKTQIAKDIRSETHAEKIQRLTQEIENKTYKISPEELADIMSRI